jgi:anthranilate/para-aminobenzoate synthase component II
MKKILLIDNYDSFTYNIFHSLSELGSKVEVYRNDKISLEKISKKNLIKLLYRLAQAILIVPASA